MKGIEVWMALHGKVESDLGVLETVVEQVLDPTLERERRASFTSRLWTDMTNTGSFHRRRNVLNMLTLAGFGEEPSTLAVNVLEALAERSRVPICESLLTLVDDRDILAETNQTIRQSSEAARAALRHLDWQSSQES
jgi:hypothetical protein